MDIRDEIVVLECCGGPLDGEFVSFTNVEVAMGRFWGKKHLAGKGHSYYEVVGEYPNRILRWESIKP